MKNNLVFLLYLLAIAGLESFHCISEFIVDQQGKHDFTTIQGCVDHLKTDGSAGDKCRIKAGRYHENIVINSLHGKPGSEYVIEGYENERPILDGTILMKSSLNWKPVEEGSKIYKTKIDRDVWQLFVDNKMMTNARWPNAKFSDYSIFNGRLWSKLHKDSTRGTIINKGHSLAKTNVSMKGAVAVLNIGSFTTYVAKVQNHSAGENEFTYEDTFGPILFKPKNSKYFIEDKLELLDTAEEWFYNKTTKELYVWLTNGDSPSGHKVRGKVQTYAMNITNTTNLILKNLDFFATTISATSSKFENVDKIRFDSLIFDYPTYSKRMLGDISLIERGKVLGKSKNGYGSFVFFNNTFYGSDGTFLDVDGKEATFENNLIEYNDWSGANYIKASGGDGPIESFSQKDYYIRNTLRFNGASTGLQPGRKPEVYLNHVIGQGWGVIQNDGAGVQVKKNSQTMANVSYNWAHSSPKFGIRFDGQPPLRSGKLGLMSYNVAFQSNGIMVKGNYHIVKNNLAFDKYNEGDDDEQGEGCTFCVLKYVRTNPIEINTQTVVFNNVADVGNGGKDKLFNKGTYFKVAGRLVVNNDFSANIVDEIMDANNFDFRPVEGSDTALKGRGPYKFEEKMQKYWIPGRQLYKTSTPIPKDASNNVKAERRDALMFLEAYGCSTHIVYFGEDEEKVHNANSKSDPAYLGTLENGANVCYLPTSKKVESGKTYYWRVDAQPAAGVIYRGDVWSFTTK